MFINHEKLHTDSPMGYRYISIINICENLHSALNIQNRGNLYVKCVKTHTLIYHNRKFHIS